MTTGGFHERSNIDSVETFAEKRSILVAAIPNTKPNIKKEPQSLFRPPQSLYESNDAMEN